MKMLDPKNVILKSNKMMEAHLEMFAKHLGDYESCGDNYYFYDNETQSLKINYEQNKKMLTKVFSISVKLALKDLDMAASWRLRSAFAGKVRPEGLYFKGANKASRFMEEIVNNQTDEMMNLFQQTQQVDLMNITAEYNKEAQTLTISINPYAGAFVWIKLPPVYHDIRLRENEIKAICNIIETMKTLFLKTVREGSVYKIS